MLLKLNQNHSTYEFQDSLRSQITDSAVTDSLPTLLHLNDNFILYMRFFEYHIPPAYNSYPTT